MKVSFLLPPTLAMFENNLVHSCPSLFTPHHLFHHRFKSDLMEWVRENHSLFAYRHLSGLLHQTLSASNMTLNNKKLKDALALLDSLFQESGKEDDKSLVNLLGRMQSSSEASKLSFLVKGFKK